jgi:diguanylate cyclase (GGDEF)-like protein
MKQFLMTPKRTDESCQYERREAERRQAFDSGHSPIEIDGIKLGKDEYGGVADAFAFPLLMAVAAIFLAIVAGAVVVQTNPQWITDYFVALTAGVAIIITAPLTIVAGIREYRKLKSHKAVRSLASLDPLTGLMNRRSFSASLDVELKRMNRTRHAAAVILFDLDHFKKLNDRFGHHIGDEVLTSVASIAYSELRNPFDRLARWGGEEFIILLHDMSEETARGVCERLRKRIGELSLNAENQSVSVTASFGGSLLRPDRPFSEALYQADTALYEAKSNGRDRVEFKRCIQLAA